MSGRYPDLNENGAAKNNVVSFPGETSHAPKITEAQAKKQARDSRPRGLTKSEQKVWDRVVQEMILIGRFKGHFVEFFKNYAVVVSRMEAFLDFLNAEENGWTYIAKGRNGVQHKSRPEAAQYNDDWRKWNSMVNQLGMSPATDARFHGLQPDLFATDPYAGL